MRFNDWIATVDTHTEGQATRIITGGVRPLPGPSLAAKMRFFREELDYLRVALISEPRGHRDMYGCMLTAPTVEGADYGMFFMDNSGLMNMCGHATVGVSTALVELGMVKVTEPVTPIVFETAAGIVRANVSVEQGRPRSVSFNNVPAYVEHLDAEISVPGIGRILVDVAYGGNQFVFFSANDAGIDVSSENIKKIVDAGMNVMDAANEQLRVTRPENGNGKPINIATIIAEPKDPAATYRNVHVFGPRQFDRSPGGTGTSARLAVLSAKGLLGENEEVIVESLTGGFFRGRILEQVMIDGKGATLTQVTGSAHITGFHQFVIDSEDRLRHGFLIE
ncbi:MAG: proline racemase family protein [Acidobacteria bacterium]|nr:proline racemase family protein [Acidobacteriota bacterium]MCW5969083.1 proline racemase family protein [Blastocatellales bacterium]